MSRGFMRDIPMWSGTLIIKKNWIWMDKWPDINYRLRLFLSQPSRMVVDPSSTRMDGWKNSAFCSPADLDKAQHFKCIPCFWLHTLNTPPRSIHRQEGGWKFTSSPQLLDHAGGSILQPWVKVQKAKKTQFVLWWQGATCTKF